MLNENAKVLYLQHADTFDSVVEMLGNDEVIVLPCDTIYGICARMGDVTEKKIRSIKKRDENKPFLVLATLEQACDIADVPDDVKQAWPSPMTAILNRKSGGTIAIRVPNDPFLQAVMTKLGSPIFSTSVNESGYTAITNIMDIIVSYKDLIPAFVMDSFKQGDVPSTLVNCTERPYRIIREGQYDATSLVENSGK